MSLHLLGYLYDPASPELRDERARLRSSRLSRGEAIVAELGLAGYPIKWDRVVQIAAGAAVGRPHIARALVESGAVATVDEAFAELLSSRSPFYLPKQDMPVETAITLIRAAGGVTVIAHPWARARGPVLAEADLHDLVRMGLHGVEVDHPDQLPPDRERLRAFAAETGLIATGSSDYHGTNKSTPIAAEQSSAQALERIVDAATGAEPVYSVGGGRR